MLAYIKLHIDISDDLFYENKGNAFHFSLADRCTAQVVGYFTQNKVIQFTHLLRINSLIFERKAEKDLTDKHLTTKACIVLTDITVCNRESKENVRNLNVIILVP